MREPNHADVDGIFCRRGNRDCGGQRWSWRWLSGCEHCQPAHAGGVQAGTKDVGGTDNRCDGASGAGAACGCAGSDKSRSRTGAAQQQPQTQQQSQPQTQAAAPSTNAPPAEEKTANNVAAAQPVQSPPQPSKLTEQADEKAAGPRDVFARARDADIKRADAEKRRAERRQQWADKRRLKQPREQELEAVEERVREVTEPRRIRIREEVEPRGMFAEPARSETRGIRLFGQDD